MVKPAPEAQATPDPAVSDAARADAIAKANGAPDPTDPTAKATPAADKGPTPQLGEMVFWKGHEPHSTVRPAMVVGVPRNDMPDQHNVTLEVFGMPVAEGSRIVSGTSGNGYGQWSRERPARS